MAFLSRSVYPWPKSRAHISFNSYCINSVLSHFSIEFQNLYGFLHRIVFRSFMYFQLVEVF